MENTFYISVALDSTALVNGKQLVSMSKPRDKRSTSLPSLIFYGPTKS